MQNTLQKGLDYLKKKAADYGVGYEHIAKPMGKGGFEHYNEFKFGKLGKIDVPQGKVEYNRPKEMPVTVVPTRKTMQMNAVKNKILQYGDKGYKPSNGKGVGG
jgi:hypothetical protein